MSAKAPITRGEFLRIKRALEGAQYDSRSLSRTKRLLQQILPARNDAWSQIDLAVVSGESARALISRFGLRVKSCGRQSK
jgi:hypothetical protein